MRKASNRPTNTELGILRALWDLGPSTVRQVHERLAQEQGDLNYQAVLRMMQLMAEKGQLQRDDTGRSHVYRTVEPKSAVHGSLVDDLLERAFGGNTLELLAATLSRRKMSAKEREQARQLIAQALKEKP